MTAHIAKVTLFLLLQVGIYAGLQVNGDTSSFGESIAAKDPESRLEEHIKEEVRPLWESDPDIIKNALQAGPQKGLIASLVLQYLAGPDNYLVAAIDKRERLCCTEGRRLILIGGSNVAFSMDSPLLEQRYGLAPVNMGLKAGLGPRFMTRQVDDQIRDGDVVVIMMEHIAMFGGGDAPARIQTAFCKACPEQACFFEAPADDNNEDAAIDWNWNAIKHYADREALAGLASDCRDSAAHAWSRVRGPVDNNTTAGGDFDRQIEPLVAAARKRLNVLNRVYARSGFNRYGDMVRHRTEAPAEPDKINGLRIGFRPKTEPQIRESITVLNSFAATCAERGARVFFAHPPMPKSRNFLANAQKYEAILAEGLEFPILFPIEKSFVEINEMYDSCYHLNWSGTTRRMALLCAGLDQYLTPQSEQSISEMIAARDRVVRGTAVAVQPSSASRIQ